MPKDKYPNGKLNEQDEGALKVAVGIVKGRVLVDFGKNVKWLAFTKDEAVAFATVILEKAKTLE